MISTFIYGSPHGFNFYEGIASWNDYFKSFYISARRGKRLMVNRKDDGITIYSYLCYGLMEKEGRPNAFFGVSLILDDYKFTPDLKVLFEWFDYLFDKIISRGNLFFINEGGILQYKVDRFSDVSVEIDWLKSNMPNIFTKSSDIQILSYDNSYSRQNLGKVICCNIDTPYLKIIDNLKRFHWIALSPNFAPEQEVEEINISDLESKLNEYNQNILSIAVKPSSENLPLLSSIEAYCSDIISTLKKYGQSATEETEINNIRDILEKYNKLQSNISALIIKIKQSLPKPHDIREVQPSGRRCVSCYRVLPNKYFADSDVDICLDCQKKRKNQYRICKKCHSKKPASEFTNFVDVCDDCAKQTEQRWWEQIKPMYIALSIIAIIVTISIILVAKSCSNKVTISENPTTEITDNEEVVFNEDKFNNLLNSENYSGALEYLDSFDKRDNYIQDVREAINKKIIDILETSSVSEITERCLMFTTSNIRILKDLGLDATQFNSIAQNYQRLCEIASQSTLSDASRAEAINLISKLPAELKDTWTQRINNIRSDRPEKPQESVSIRKPEEQNTKSQFAVTITNTDNKGNAISSNTSTISQSTSLSVNAGTFVTVQCSDGVKLRAGSGVPVKNGMKVEVKSTNIVFLIGGKIRLTITPKKNDFEKV